MLAGGRRHCGGDPRMRSCYGCEHPAEWHPGLRRCGWSDRLPGGSVVCDCAEFVHELAVPGSRAVKDAVAVRCPDCKAGPGVACVLLGREPVFVVHMGRVDKANEISGRK